MTHAILAALLLVGCGASAAGPARAPADPAPCPGPEDLDGFEDDDGCVDPDNDGDDHPDVADQCPDDAEDFDGFEDDDGCPEPDNDRDRVVDACDMCPDEPETWNGTFDHDGCPDQGILVARTPADMPHQTFYFAPGSAALPADGAEALDFVAELMARYAAIERLGVDGRASRDEPDELAARRAEAVRDALVARGVAAARLAVSTSEPAERETNAEVSRRVLVRVLEDSFEEPHPPLDRPAWCEDAGRRVAE